MPPYKFYDSFLKRLRTTLNNPNNNKHYIRCPLCREPWIGIIRHLMDDHKLNYETAKKLTTHK